MDRKLVIRLAAAAVAALSTVGVAACGGDDDEPATPTPKPAAATAAKTTAAENAKVGVADNSFSPASLTVKAGTAVRWTWSGSNPHSIVGKGDNASKIPKSSTQTGSGTYELSFTNPGTYEYRCGVHGDSMSGKVIVQ
ncbi:MAG: cupredoxin domain-containing protein [Dehalococcoidia bacterium]